MAEIRAQQCVADVGPGLGWLIFGCVLLICIAACVGLAIWRDYHFASEE
jgi:hypothetical protein